MKRPFPLFFRLFTAIIFLALISILGCQRDLKDPGGSGNNPPPGGEPAVNDQEMVTGGVRGIVVDENNRPVAGATVTSGTRTILTDRYGMFVLTNLSLSKANGYVKVTKGGYFTGTRTFVSKEGRINNVRIKLIPKINTGTFTAGTGGTVNLTGGAKLVMPAGAVADASGNAYTGTVNVAMTWIDPVSQDLPFIVPGDLRGITTGGQERGLQTFGMIGVELTSASGQALNIAAGKKAELTFPLPPSLQATAPDSIDLWHFDEAAGRWKQEGKAGKSGTNYIASVSHFSFWNCDAPFPLVEVCMMVVDNHNIPIGNVQVRIKRTNGSYGYGRTDSLGNLCGKVPKNEALELQVLSNCGSVIYSQNIGPYSADASIGNITVTIPVQNSLTLTGTLTNCSNANVANGALLIYASNGNYYSFPITSGTFSRTILHCENTPVNLSVIGVDYSTVQQSTPVSITGTTGTINVGTIQACGVSAAQFVEYLIDGTPFGYVAPPDYVIASDSSFAGNMNVTIYTSQNTGSNTTFSTFTFAGNGGTGTFPLLACRIGQAGFGFSETFVTPNPTVNITTFGPLGSGFIEGNFTVQMNFAGIPKTVVATFRVRRG